MNRYMESRHLAAADFHILEGEERIARQIAVIDRLRNLSADTRPAEHLLALFRETLVEWNRHRGLILAALAE